MLKKQVTEELSLSGRHWRMVPVSGPLTGLEMPAPIATVLAQRGHTGAKLRDFLAPNYHQSLHDPFLLGGMRQGAEAIHRAIEDHDLIGIHGDYDADGLTATALLADLLRLLGAKLELIVPDRYQDGYGISEGTIARTRAVGVKTLVTVDCGISNRQEISSLMTNDVAVVVTDHHQPPAELPEATALINPRLPGDPYPNKQLAGVGVAFKLAQALLRTSQLTGTEQEKAEKWLLDLVAIGTVADLMPLTGENRTLVKYGLTVLRHGRRPGVAALASSAGIELAQIDTEAIGFRLAPRINAAGRMGSPQAALETLTASTPTAAAAGARVLSEANTSRQVATTQAINEVLTAIGEPRPDDRVIIAEGPWKSGIVGLIAGKLVGQYHRPAIVIEVAGDEARGSARSIPGFDITAAIRSQASLLTTFGGHASAGGFALPVGNLPSFRKGLTEYVCSRLSPADLVPALTIDMALTAADLTIELVEGLSVLEPTGTGNLKPIFLITGTVEACRTVGRDNAHIKLDLRLRDGRRLDAIGFGLGGIIAHLPVGAPVEVAGRPMMNGFKGNRSVEWQVEDVRLR